MPETNRFSGIRIFHEPGPWVIVIGSLLLWLAGYPLPHVDDLFYTGAGVEMAGSGRLVNPWIGPWLETFDTTQFFVSPPVLPYVLGAWLKILGTSTATLTGFHLSVQAVAELLVYRFARMSGLEWTGALAISGVTAIFTLVHGLRPEALAMLLVLSSQVCLSRATGFGIFLGALLGASAVLTHPLAMTWVIPLHLWRIAEVWRVRRELTSFFVWTTVGLAIAFLAFGFAVAWHIAEFIRVLAEYSKLLTPPWHDGPAYFWSQLTLGKQIYVIFPYSVLIAAGVARTFLRPGSDRPICILQALWGVWFASLTIGIVLYPTRTANQAVYTGVVIGILSLAKTRWINLIGAAAVGAALVHNSGSLVVPAFWRGEKPDTSAVQKAIERNHGKVVCLDEVAIRYVFDFRPPTGVHDWSQRQSAKYGARGLLAEKASHELWIVNEWKLEKWVPDSGIHAPRFHIGRFTFNSIAAEPYRVRVIE